MRVWIENGVTPKKILQHKSKGNNNGKVALLQ